MGLNVLLVDPFGMVAGHAERFPKEIHLPMTRSERYNPLDFIRDTDAQAVMLLAEGMSVREVAAAFSRGESTIRSHMKRMFAKHRLSRQADLVRLVLSLAGAPALKVGAATVRR